MAKPEHASASTFGAVVCLSLLTAGCATLPEDGHPVDVPLLHPYETVILLPGELPPAAVSFDGDIAKSACERVKARPGGPATRTTDAMTGWMVAHTPKNQWATAMAPGLALVAPFAVVALGESAVRAVQGALTKVPGREVASAVPIFYRAVVAAETERQVRELLRKHIMASTTHPVIVAKSRREIETLRSGAILQVEILSAALRRRSYFSKRLELTTVAYAKMTCARSGQTLGTAAVEYASGNRRAFRLEEWAAENGSLLGAELTASQAVLAERIFSSLFPVHGRSPAPRPATRRFGSTLLRPCEHAARVPQPIPSIGAAPHPSASLKPPATPHKGVDCPSAEWFSYSRYHVGTCSRHSRS